MGHAIVWFISFIVGGIAFRAWNVWAGIGVFIGLLIIGTLIRVGWKDVPEESKPTPGNVKGSFMEGYREARHKDDDDKEEDR